MITANQVLKIAKDLPDDGQNPTGFYGGCVYTAPDNDKWHCFAGEILVRLGYRLPASDTPMNQMSFIELLDSPNYTLSASDFEPYAINILGNAQAFADDDYVGDDGNLPLWGDVKKRVFEKYDYLLNM